MAVLGPSKEVTGMGEAWASSTGEELREADLTWSQHGAAASARHALAGWAQGRFSVGPGVGLAAWFPYSLNVLPSPWAVCLCLCLPNTACTALTPQLLLQVPRYCTVVLTVF